MSSKDAILDGMRSALSEGYPVIIVLETSEEFTALTGPLDEQLYVETKHSQFELTGLHAMTVVGYDDDKKYFIVENSWGIEWGDKGYFALPYDATNDIYELWTVTEFNIQGSLIK